MLKLDDFRTLLDKIYDEWNRAERDIKQAEQVCSEVINPAVNELRYAGRRLVDAIGRTNNGGAAKDIDALLTDALFDCHRARHDAVDAATSKIAIDLDVFREKLGIDVVLQAFSDFPALVEEVDSVRQKIVASRSARDRRENIYSGIEALDFPALVKNYNRLKSSEPIMRELAMRHRRERLKNTIFGWIGIGIGVVGLIISILSWLFPRSP